MIHGYPERNRTEFKMRSNNKEFCNRILIYRLYNNKLLIEIEILPKLLTISISTSLHSREPTQTRDDYKNWALSLLAIKYNKLYHIRYVKKNTIK
jgi:hypothetical protein